MNTQERSPAEERLLDAALQQVLAPIDAATQATGPRRAWAAAAALLGIAVVIASLVLARTQALLPAAQGQEPETPAEQPLPIEVRATDLDELDALPTDVQNLACTLPAPKELVRLQRFTCLRRVRLIGNPVVIAGAGPAGPEFWADPRPEALAPLAALPELRILDWPPAMRLQPKHLAPLAGAPKLQSMGLHGDRVEPTADLVAAFAKLPHLTELRFLIVPMTTGFLEQLAKLPLQRLEFHACPGIDDAALAKLETMRSLRGLELACLNGGTAGAPSGKSYQLGLLTAAAFASLGRMPALCELGLDESELSEELLQLLPAKLRRLDLGSRAASFGVATAVRRLGNLRDLTCGAGTGLEAAERMVSVLGALRLARLEYRGAPSERLLRAIAEQPELTELSLQLYRSIDLAPLARAPRLSSIRLQPGQQEYRPTLEDLRPLAGCKHVRRLHLFDFGLDPREVRSVLGKDVLVIEERP